MIPRLTLRPLQQCLGVFMALIACLQWSAVQAAEVTQTFTIHQELPNLVHVDLGAKGVSHGDMLAFDAAVETDNDLQGKLSGFVLTVDIPEQDHEIFQDRIVQMVFDLGDTNTLVIGGKSVYPSNYGHEMYENQPQIRAIIGGTGSFIGARGQATTTRNDDGTYEHYIQLVD
jgi:opacity protein-like surface antigen